MWTIILVCLAMATLSGAEDKAGHDKCKTPPSQPVAEELFLTKKWIIIKHSNCENCKGKRALTSLTGRSSKTIEHCWNLRTTVDGHELTAPIKCRYLINNGMFNSTGQCELQTSRVPKLGGAHTIFGTDGKTFIVGSFCILNHENFWYIAAVEGHEDSQDLEKLLKIVEHAKFNKTNIAEKEKGDIVFEDFVMTPECPKAKTPPKQAAR